MAYIAAGSFVLPAGIGLARFKRLRRAMKLFAILMVLTLLQVAAQIIVPYFGYSNYFLLNSFIPIECGLFLAVFYLATASATSKALLGSGIAFILVFWIYYTVFIDVATQLNNPLSAAAGGLIAIAGAGALFELTRDTATPLTTRPLFWVGAGAVLYSAGTLFILGLSNRLLALGIEYFAAGWYVNWILTIISNLMYTKGFLCTTP